MPEEAITLEEPKIILSAEQEKLILETFNKNEGGVIPSVTSLVKLAFPNLKDIDGRSKEGRAIKELLVSKGMRAKTTTTYQVKEKILLTRAQMEFISNNHKNMTMVEMSRTLFHNPSLGALNQETRSIAEYVKLLDPSKFEASNIPEGAYSPPKTIAGVYQKVNQYVWNHEISKSDMTAQQKTGLETLLGYMNTFRFAHQINLYDEQSNRDLFESEFISCTYDKNDLTPEEVSQYIILSHESVNSANIQRRMENLQKMMDNVAEEEKQRISMSLVEAIGKLQTEYHQSVKRVQDLLGDLKEKRSKRMEEKRSAHASVLNLVQLWKQERTRKKLLYLGDARKKVLEKAAMELSSMDSVKATLLGIDVDEVINS